MNMEKVGIFISERRKALNLTQRDLGERLQVTDKAISKWERGLCCPDVELLGQLALILKCNISEILNGENSDIYLSSNREIGDFGDKEVEDYARTVSVELNLDSTVSVSPYLFGNNLEHTRSSIHTGLSAQMLRNRKFVGKPACCYGYAECWYPIGDRAYFSFGAPYTRHAEDYHMKRSLECNSQVITSYLEGAVSGIGQRNLHIQKGVCYEFRGVFKAFAPLTVMVALVGGDKEYASGEITVENGDFAEKTLVLQAPETDKNAALEIRFAGVGTLTVGALSLMPEGHFRGMRRDVIALMRDMGIKLLRWPGGNFAGEYNWKDGLMPCDMRAPFESYMGLETQPHSMGYDFHEINTDDFVALCREIGAEPFITINPTWNTPKESAQWVEYCNGDEKTQYGKIRIARGYLEPYNVQFWSLGNEFGYGHMEGDNNAYGYYKTVAEHGKEMLKVCPHLTYCSSGPYPNEEWVEHAAKPLGSMAPLISIHAYPLYPDYIDPAKRKEEYYHCIDGVDFWARMKLIKTRALLKNDDIRISLDEWNTWYAWYRPGSVTDGIFTAYMLHMIIDESDKLGVDVACHFEAVNESAIRVETGRSFLTPTGKMFAVMKHHANGMLCASGQDVIATLKEGVLTVTLLNRAFDDQKKFILPACGKMLTSQLYTAEDVVPGTEFTVSDVELQKTGDAYEITLPKHSVMLLQLELEKT